MASPSGPPRFVPPPSHLVPVPSPVYFHLPPCCCCPPPSSLCCSAYTSPCAPHLAYPYPFPAGQHCPCYFPPPPLLHPLHAAWWSGHPPLDSAPEEEIVGEEGEEMEEIVEVLDEEVVETATEDYAPFYVLSEEAIALFARSEERRRKERNRRRKEQAKAREEAKKAREARKTGTFVTRQSIGADSTGEVTSRDDGRVRFFGTQGVDTVEELEGMLGSIFNRACDLKKPVVWPSMPLRLGS